MRAEAFINTDRDQDALAALEAAAKGSPDNGEVQWMLGLVNGKLGHLDASERAYARAKALGVSHDPIKVDPIP